LCSSIFIEISSDSPKWGQSLKKDLLTQRPKADQDTQPIHAAQDAESRSNPRETSSLATIAALVRPGATSQMRSVSDLTGAAK
jgi:hypothetical protein